MSHDMPEPTAPAAYPPAGSAAFPETVIISGSDLPSTDLSDDSAPSLASNTDASPTDVAKEQAASVGQGAADAGKHVAGVAKDQATGVAAETTKQAKDLLSQTRTELQGQAATQQDRIAAGIRSLSSELGSMAQNSDGSGTATDLVRQVSARAEDIAGWLEERDPGALVQEVTAFARRRPGAFLAVAVGAGLLAGRLTRGAIDAARDDGPPQAGPATTPPAVSLSTTSVPPAAADPAHVTTGAVEADPLWETQARL